MKQLPDDLFRRRLKDHGLTPPPSAWSRVESTLPGRRRNSWLRIAAALLLLFTAGALIVLVRDNRNPQTIAEEHALPKASPPQLADTTPGAESTHPDRTIPAEETPATAEAHTVTRDSGANKTTTTKNEASTNHTDQQVAETLRVAPDDTATAEVTPETNPSVSPVTATAAPVEDAPFKLVLEVDEVRTKYLRKKSVAHATEEEAQPSGLKKLLDKANDISNQDHIGDLRQMKNEIFALNFQGKKRDQHK